MFFFDSPLLSIRVITTNGMSWYKFFYIYIMKRHEREKKKTYRKFILVSLPYFSYRTEEKKTRRKLSLLVYIYDEND